MRYMKEIVEDKNLEFASKVKTENRSKPVASCANLDYAVSHFLVVEFSSVFLFDFQWQRRSELNVYTQKDLDVVRSEWARFVLKYHT